MMVFKVFITRQMLEDGMLDIRKYILLLMGYYEIAEINIGNVIEIPEERLEILYA